jgi:DNA-binding response OmpR family regulator
MLGSSEQESQVMEDAEQRAAGGLEGWVFDSEEVTLDASARVARFRERTIRFTPVEFRLLEALLLHAPGQFLTREQLLSIVWGADEPRSNIVDAYVCRLRRKLGEGSIQTLHGVGYRMAVRGGLRREERSDLRRG